MGRTLPIFLKKIEVVKMIILTAANKDIAKDDFGKVYKNFSFREVILQTMQKAKECGYTPLVYDLGTLGIGKPFIVSDKTFAEKGYYEKEIHKGYKSKSLFKPELIKVCMAEYNEFLVYLDGDAQLYGNIDEIVSEDFDIGVTLREAFEIESDWHREHFDIVKYINAGVIFFNKTTAAAKFIDVWQQKTEELGNDQKALNLLACPDSYPEVYSIIRQNGVRIKFFPAKKYNYYYFEYGLNPDIKIMHFKGDVRHYYPFDWKKRLFCQTLIPLKNFMRPVVKKMMLHR